MKKKGNLPGNPDEDVFLVFDRCDTTDVRVCVTLSAAEVERNNRPNNMVTTWTNSGEKEKK